MRLTISSGALLLLTLCAPVLPAAHASDGPEGVEHFYKVDQQVYRGAQPTAEGIKSLASMGVKTVIDLRESPNAEWEEPLVKAAGMRYLNFPIAGLAAPTDQQTEQILKILNDKSAGPVFVHCRRGKDRTGAIVAVYRITHDGWDNAKALKEARHLGMSWFEFPKQQYVLSYSARGRTQQPAIVPASLTAPAPAQ